MSTQSALQASTSQDLSAGFSAGRFPGRTGGRDGSEGENAIFLSLAKYTPSGSRTDRISAGQEMILVRSREERVQLGWTGTGGSNKGCPTGRDRVGPGAACEWQYLC